MRCCLTWFVMALVLVGCDYTEKEKEIGFKGKARLNSWLAAERVAAELVDYEIHSHPSWTVPDADDAVWFLPASILGNESFTSLVEQWVDDGGHLVLLAEHADSQINDWSPFHDPPRYERALHEMLGRFEMELIEDRPSKADKIELEGEEFQVDAASDSSVVLDGGKPAIFASTIRGEGRLSVLMDGRLFRNRWIGEKDHAALLYQLIQISEYEGSIAFTRGSGLSLMGLMMKKLWMVLLALGVLILLWLWKNFARFGPLESAAEAPVLRGYEHHLEALGDFQWRLDRGVGLLAPLRAQIVERGQRLSTRAGRRDEDFFQFLADRSGIPRERVFRALAEPAPADATILTRTAADLQRLLQVLH